MSEALRLIPVGTPESAGILGASAAIRRAEAQARSIASSDLPVLLVGETGTGKELFAQAIHRWSGRPRLVDVNCGALPPQMAESLLFGHRKGAFTGAVDNAPGLFLHASAGTLFLDELTALPLESQVKLLRVLETGEVRRLGEAEKLRVSFRLVAAVQCDLHRLIQAGAFRLDLYQRLAVGAVIRLPALRERPEDTLALAGEFARLVDKRLHPTAESVLLGYDWPGNVRELRAVVARAARLVAGVEIGPFALSDAIAEGVVPLGGEAAQRPAVRRDQGDAELLRETCVRHGWSAERIASALGVHRATLFRRLKAAGLSLKAPSRRESRDCRATGCDWEQSSHG
jgi:transcriptional regulator with PAS, ATPase and Fis domain